MNKIVSKNKKSLVRVGHIGLTILKVVAVAGVVVTVVVLPGIATLIAPFLKDKRYSHKRALQRNIKSLVRNGLVRESKNRRGETTLEITKRGKWEAVIHHDHAEQSKKKWDGVWHVVIFDIPITRERKVRSELHRAMKLYGFYMLQKSVWVYPHDCEMFLRKLKEYLGVSNDIVYMKSNFIENDRELKRNFSLS